MGWEAWLTLAAVGLMMAALVRNWAPTDVVMLTVLAVLTTVGALTETGRLPAPAEAFRLFGNEALVTVGVLFVVVAGLTQTGAMSLLTQPLLGRPRTVLAAQSRMMFPLAGLSAFLNNTPIVAMFMPVIGDWCKKNNLSPSKLFIPLSYATILGGVCSVIGTSTNLLVNGLWISTGRPSLSLFSITWIGLPVAAAGLLYLVLFSRRLLPDRRPAISRSDDPREYTVEMLVEPGSSLVGQSIEQAGLRHLPGMYLVEIDRNGHVLPAVANTERLAANDRLIFVGVVESVIDLQRIRGLKVATDQVFKLDAPRTERVLVEAVVSDSCPLLGMTVRDGRFRSVYNAAVIAVARNGERVRKKIGDIVLRTGDTLLLEAGPAFAEHQRNSRDFLLVSTVQGATPPRHDKAWIALATLAAMVALAGFEVLTMLNAALLAGGVMVLTGCCTASEARRSIDWQVLLIIGAALGLGRAMQSSGAAQAIAGTFISAAGANPWLLLGALYLITTAFTELMSNNTAAAVVFPIAMATAASLGAHGVDPMPFVMTIMIAASCGFATPLGYQTHLMVYGPGGYRFTDFVRIGLPLDLLCGVVTVALVPLIWPFKSVLVP